jgi:excisionase family DNA binding protein
VTVRSKRAARQEWISLHEAGELLGISASTLRRWSDSGLIRTFVTPGGHRRFSREAVVAILPSAGSRP